MGVYHTGIKKRRRMGTVDRGVHERLFFSSSMDNDWSRYVLALNYIKLCKAPQQINI